MAKGRRRTHHLHHQLLAPHRLGVPLRLACLLGTAAVAFGLWGLARFASSKGGGCLWLLMLPALLIGVDMVYLLLVGALSGTPPW